MGKIITLTRQNSLLIVLLFCLVNYFLAFRGLRYLKYEDEKLKGSAIAIIVLSYALFGAIAYFYKNKFFPS